MAKKNNSDRGLERGLGTRIKENRQIKHITAEKFAADVDISLPFLWEVERGNKRLSLPTFVKMANVLGVSTDDLLCDSLDGGTPAQLNVITKKLEGLSKEQLKIVELSVDSILSAFKNVK